MFDINDYFNHSWVFKLFCYNWYLLNMYFFIIAIVKETAVFQFQLNNIRFTVYGKYIATRPSERSVKKIKGFMVPEL